MLNLLIEFVLHSTLVFCTLKTCDFIGCILKNRYRIVTIDQYGYEFSYIRYADTPERACENLGTQYNWYCDWNKYYDDSNNKFAEGTFMKRDYRRIWQIKYKFKAFLEK